MKIIGHGIDLESETAVRKYLKSRPGWAEGIFSADERLLAGEPSRHGRFFAERFAGKEAVAKALGTGFAGTVSWHGIEILSLPSGAPCVRLNGSTLEFAISIGVTAWFISISYRSDLTLASVIAVGD